MAITETARRNHDELFPDRISTLAQTDPELIERFDNFAFDEVLADSDLDTRTRLMVQVFDFLHAANDVLAERGVQLPLPGQSTTTPAARLERGLAVQKQIVGGDRVDAMYHAAPDDEQHLVKGHVANLNVGNDRARLLSVLTVLIPFIGYPRTLNALGVLDEVAPADRNERAGS